MITCGTVPAPRPAHIGVPHITRIAAGQRLIVTGVTRRPGKFPAVETVSGDPRAAQQAGDWCAAAMVHQERRRANALV
jgi:hypothetical protein